MLGHRGKELFVHESSAEEKAPGETYDVVKFKGF